MEYMRIARLREDDFDEIIASCGGHRAVVDHTRSTAPNADYILNEAIIELKLIDEEGLDKENRQKKVAELFRATQPGKPTVVLDAGILGRDSKKAYYNLMEGPIKTHVKKAAKQIDHTQKTLSAKKLRVLLVVNVGYTALDMKEFSSVVLKCARNDTSKIDYVIAAGLYYYSDRFDGYVFTPFELFPINVASPFQSFESLKDSWHTLTEKFMTSFVLGQQQLDNDRLPVIDIKFWHEDRLFVKPAPRFGKPSVFWPEGKRPRENSTGISVCPPIAMTFPDLTVQQWTRFKEFFPKDHHFRSSYSDWGSWSDQEAERLHDKLKPFVKVSVDFEQCRSWCGQHYGHWGFSEICEFARKCFDEQAKETIAKAIQKSTVKVLVPHYIYLITEEIGQDMENDLSSIYFVSQIPGFERKETILENERMFFEHAVALAAAYAIRRKATIVMYGKDQKYRYDPGT